MRTTLTARRLTAALLTIAAATAVMPATAGALTPTITGDAGTPVPFTTPVTIRNMSPTFGVAFAAGENYNYSATLADAGGNQAATPVSCYSSSAPGTRSVDYHGNGAYTATVTLYAPTDHSCAKAAVAAPQSFQFVIAASVAVGAPAGRVLIRDPNSYVTKTLALPVTLNPGALGYDVQYAPGAVLAPDGSISGPSTTGYVDTTAGTIPLSLRTPGRYLVVARARGFSTGAGTFATAWSPAAVVNAVAPFDAQSLTIPDSRGPSYRIRLQLREATARGRVTIGIRRGTKGSFRSIGHATLGRNAVLGKRFSAHRTGTYTLRFVYRGSSTTAAGEIRAGVRITRRLLFR